MTKGNRSKREKNKNNSQERISPTPNNNEDSRVFDLIQGEQLQALDDTDVYASVWEHVLQSSSSKFDVLWGGRGKGGRGLARQTYQPKDIIVPDVTLHYVASSKRPPSILLEGSTLKILSSCKEKVYAIVGQNGCGKSTLLRRMNAGKIPGFPQHITTMYVPQEVLLEKQEQEEKLTPLDFLMKRYRTSQQQSHDANQLRISQLESLLEEMLIEEAPTSGDDGNDDSKQQKIEDTSEEICILESENEALNEGLLDESGNFVNDEIATKTALQCLAFFGIDQNAAMSANLRELSGGTLKKCTLASVLMHPPQLLLLDEPSNFLDVPGLFQLRQLMSHLTSSKQNPTTILIVSHDVDLINDVATDVIYFANQQLSYFAGNYRQFQRVKEQQDINTGRQVHALHQKRQHMLHTIDTLKKQAGNDQKKARALQSRKKKLMKAGLEKNESGHRWKAQDANTGMKVGSINSIDASTRNKFSERQLLKLAEGKLAPTIDKSIQFVFRNVNFKFGEPLIMAMDIGHGYNATNEKPDTQTNGCSIDSLLFDCVDLCIREGSQTCILGVNGCGKSTMLRLLAGFSGQPVRGKVQHAQNLKIGYFAQHVADELIEQAYCHSLNESNKKFVEYITPLSMLQAIFPTKTEQDLRGELTSFGLSPQKAIMDVSFLSGGERMRLCLASMMLKDPQILVLDEPTTHLDLDSVEALIHGLKQWDGSVLMVSHDANFIRSLDADCFVISDKRLCHIPGGIDSYLKAFTV